MDTEMVVQILEVIMYVMFGCSWPFNIAKSIKTKSTKGKSLLFLILIDTGYVASMAAKIVGYDAAKWSTNWWVFMFITLNFIMVSTDLILYFINKNREKKLAISQAQ